MGNSETKDVPAIREAVAEEVRAWLGRRRLSGRALALALNRSHIYVHRRLTGETAFDVDDLAAVAEVLNVPMVDLLPLAARYGRVTRELTTPTAPAPRPAFSSRPANRTDPSGPHRAVRLDRPATHR